MLPTRRASIQIVHRSGLLIINITAVYNKLGKAVENVGQIGIYWSVGGGSDANYGALVIQASSHCPTRSLPRPDSPEGFRWESSLSLARVCASRGWDLEETGPGALLTTMSFDQCTSASQAHGPVADRITVLE